MKLRPTFKLIDILEQQQHRVYPVKKEADTAMFCRKTYETFGKKGMDSLDKRLRQLEKELKAKNPDPAAKKEFNEKYLFKILDTWLAELFEQLITVGQKFNRFFEEPDHRIYIVSGIGAVDFKK